MWVVCWCVMCHVPGPYVECAVCHVQCMCQLCVMYPVPPSCVVCCMWCVCGVLDVCCVVCCICDVCLLCYVCVVCYVCVCFVAWWVSQCVLSDTSITGSVNLSWKTFFTIVMWKLYCQQWIRLHLVWSPHTGEMKLPLVYLGFGYKMFSTNSQLA